MSTCDPLSPAPLIQSGKEQLFMTRTKSPDVVTVGEPKAGAVLVPLFWPRQPSCPPPPAPEVAADELEAELTSELVTEVASELEAFAVLVSVVAFVVPAEDAEGATLALDTDAPPLPTTAAPPLPTTVAVLPAPPEPASGELSSPVHDASAMTDPETASIEGRAIANLKAMG
jgi:hypothetical protein